MGATTPTIRSPRELAGRMAKLAQLIRDATAQVLKTEGLSGSLHDQFDSFRQVLLPGLTSDQFADMYAQTICYGLFAARFNHKGAQPFDRSTAARDLPRTNPFLQKTFYSITGPDLDERIDWAVDEVANLLNRVDIAAILKDFGRRTRQEDPVVHFYETFLAEYDPKMREHAAFTILLSRSFPTSCGAWITCSKPPLACRTAWPTARRSAAKRPTVRRPLKPTGCRFLTRLPAREHSSAA